MKSFFRESKKANALMDVLTIILILIVMGLAAIFGAQILDELNDGIQDDADIGNSTKELTASLNTNYTPLMDSLFVLAFVLLSVFVIVSVFFIDTHPIFFIIAVFTLLFLFLLAMLLGNVTHDILSDDSLSVYANNFTYTSWILQHLLELSIGLGFITAIVMYIKFKG